MLLELSEEQSLLAVSLDKMAEKYRQPPTDHAVYVQYSDDLQRELAEAGFLDIARAEGYGPLDAALLVERVARLPFSVEVAASALVAPLLDRALDGPLALCEGAGRPTRYLPQARHVCILSSNGVDFADVDGAEVQSVGSVIAYPLGVLAERPAGAVRLDDPLAEKVRTMWRIALAAEAAGLMRAALDLTVGYVKERQQFKQPLGNFQAIQHRLAADEQIVSASFGLAMRAAWSLDAREAATAALYVQQQMRTIIYDCHQFHGAMGVTLEYPLHLWTYRLKFIQGELGGWAAQANVLADLLWPQDSGAAPNDGAKSVARKLSS